jgi:hypothetical protein
MKPRPMYGARYEAWLHAESMKKQAYVPSVTFEEMSFALRFSHAMDRLQRICESEEHKDGSMSEHEKNMLTRQEAQRKRRKASEPNDLHP